MTNSKMWSAPDIVPSITYSDVPRAAEWLARVFGLHERAEPPHDLRERSTHAYPCGARGVTITTRRKRESAENCGGDSVFLISGLLGLVVGIPLLPITLR